MRFIIYKALVLVVMSQSDGVLIVQLGEFLEFGLQAVRVLVHQCSDADGQFVIADVLFEGFAMFGVDIKGLFLIADHRTVPDHHSVMDALGHIFDDVG